MTTENKKIKELRFWFSTDDSRTTADGTDNYCRQTLPFSFPCMQACKGRW